MNDAEIQYLVDHASFTYNAPVESLDDLEIMRHIEITVDTIKNRCFELPDSVLCDYNVWHDNAIVNNYLNKHFVNVYFERLDNLVMILFIKNRYIETGFAIGRINFAKYLGTL